MLNDPDTARRLRSTVRIGRCENPNARRLFRKAATPSNTISHVLLVEPDDDLCLWLWYATVTAGARVTITESICGAAAELSGHDDIGLVIVDAELPDGRGKAVAAYASENGVSFLLIRRLAGHLRVRDAAGRTFEALEHEAVEFVRQALRVAMPSRVAFRSASRRAKARIADGHRMCGNK